MHEPQVSFYNMWKRSQLIFLFCSWNWAEICLFWFSRCKQYLPRCHLPVLLQTNCHISAMPASNQMQAVPVQRQYLRDMRQKSKSGRGRWACAYNLCWPRVGRRRLLGVGCVRKMLSYFIYLLLKMPFSMRCNEFKIMNYFCCRLADGTVYYENIRTVYYHKILSFDCTLANLFILYTYRAWEPKMKQQLKL